MQVREAFWWYLNFDSLHIYVKRQHERFSASCLSFSRPQLCYHSITQLPSPLNQKRDYNEMVDHNVSSAEMITPIASVNYIELDMFGRANIFDTEEKWARCELKQAPKTWKAIWQEYGVIKVFALMRRRRRNLGDNPSRRKPQRQGINSREQATNESDLVDTYGTSATGNHTGDDVTTNGKGHAPALPSVGERVLSGRRRRSTRFSTKSVFKLVTCCFSPGQPLED